MAAESGRHPANKPPRGIPTPGAVRVAQLISVAATPHRFRRVDGGPAMHDLNGFFREMFGALSAIVINPSKFRRFAKNVLGERDNLGERARLKLQIAAAFKTTFAATIEGAVGHRRVHEDEVRTCA